MLQYGTRISSPDDELQKISVERLYKAIAQPKPAFRQQLQRLRMIRGMDERQYSRLKRQLPYFVCGNFYPAYRRKDNFAAIHYFVIDLDHLQEAGLSLPDTRKQLSSCEELLMLFVSPGGDGLKLLFRLREKCTDPGIYSYFYKAFQQDLATRFGLEKVIDARTHDVTRACFLSIDAKAYFNPEAESVNLADYFDPLELDAQYQVRQGQKALRKKSVQQAAPRREAPSDEVLLDIKKKLNPNFRPRKQKQSYLPPELKESMPRIRARLEELQILLVEEQNINYGKKLKLGAGPHWAVITIFFGKKGFSIVKTTQSGSNAELAQLCYQVIFELLYPEKL